MNLGQTEAHRPQAARRTYHGTPSTWNFAELQDLLERPSVYPQGLRKLYLAVFEATVMDVIHERDFGQAVPHLRDYLARNAPDHAFALDIVCDVLDLPADAVREGLLKLLGGPRRSGVTRVRRANAGGTR